MTVYCGQRVNICTEPEEGVGRVHYGKIAEASVAVGFMTQGGTVWILRRMMEVRQYEMHPPTPCI
jgi:hypothetical protein